MSKLSSFGSTHESLASLVAARPRNAAASPNQSVSKGVAFVFRIAQSPQCLSFIVHERGLQVAVVMPSAAEIPPISYYGRRISCLRLHLQDGVSRRQCYRLVVLKDEDTLVRQ